MGDVRAIRVRVALPMDIVAIARVWHQGWHVGHAAALPWLVPLRPFAAFEIKASGVLGRCLVAEADDGEVVGFVAWDGAELGQLFIVLPRLGDGLGRFLLAAAEGAMRASGVDEANLTCVVGNERARAFYLRHGWVERGTEDYPACAGGRILPVQVWRLTKPL